MPDYRLPAALHIRVQFMFLFPFFHAMHIVLNGESRPLISGTALTQLIKELGLEGKRLAVEINLEIIPRSQYATTELKNGDTIEIVHAIGGG
jgi:sulfur carrier protein